METSGILGNNVSIVATFVLARRGLLNGPCCWTGLTFAAGAGGTACCWAGLAFAAGAIGMTAAAFAATGTGGLLFPDGAFRHALVEAIERPTVLLWVALALVGVTAMPNIF